MESELRPRLCFLTKGESGYGFHLHGERNRCGQFIRKVEPGSSAELSGLQPGDRLVEVNGENVENESHHQVVERILAVGHRTRLLVVDRETDDYLHRHGLACTEDLAIEMGTLSPRPSPRSTPSASPLPRENGTISPQHILKQLLKASNSPSPARYFTYSPSPSRASKLSLETDTESELLMEQPLKLPGEPDVERLPRMGCLLKREQGYGFNLHSDKTRQGQFIRSVDPCSAAERADIRAGDRLVEVNGVSVEGLRHSEVVELISTGGEEVSLLVVDQETDDLFQKLGIIPTSSHVKEVYVDESPLTESGVPNPSPTSDLPGTDPPIINLRLTDSPITNGSSMSRTNGSSASQSSVGSTTLSEFSCSDMSIQVPDEDESQVSDSFFESGLRLSPSAAIAKEKARSKRNKKRAPPMDWSKKQEIFSNL